MKKIFILIALIGLVAVGAYAWNPLVSTGGGGTLCSEASDTIIIGFDDLASNSTKAADTLYLTRAQAQYDCTIDKLHLKTNDQWGVGEGVVAGIYNDAGTTLLAQSDEVDGDGVADVETIALQSSVSLVSGTWYILVWHNEAQFYNFWGVKAAGNKTKIIDRGSYSTTLPATVDVTGMTDAYSSTFYGTNP